jgi:VWFA-related protein
MFVPARTLAFLTFISFSTNSLLAQSADASPAPNAPSQAQTESPGILTLRSTVRRVVVDVVVRDSNNQPVHGLTAKDFLVAEDGHPQNILSFDTYNLDTPSIALPPNAPHPPANHFVNIPPIPERGPLYVILYDLVNTDVDDQIDARRQVMKFIKGMPEGTRFAIFIRSDGLYLVQGFTADKSLLYATLDPQHPKPHVPRVFTMGHNLGYRDPASMMNVLTQVTEFLAGIPGHKNLIWLAGTFPLALSPRAGDPRAYEDEIIAEINVLTRAQVAVYPLNVGGVPVNPPVQKEAGVGDSLITDYDVQKNLADSTGGHAFYSTNDVTAALDDATNIGGNYYSLTYSPSNAKDDGGRRSIAVRVAQKGYKLAYRRYYFTSALRPNSQSGNPQASSEGTPSTPVDPNDTLQSNMRHGAPMLHDLLFSAHIHADGRPAKATAEQMTQLGDEPAYASTHHKDKPLAPVDLQKYVIDYRVTASGLKGQTQTGTPPEYEFAAVAYDAESAMLNGVVNNAAGDVSSTQEPAKSGALRARQQLDVPVNAAWIRIGVRDKLTNRIGTLEVPLPLAPEPPSPSVTSER